MKVSDLIRKLSKLDPEAEIVLMSAEDGYSEPTLGAEKITLIKRRPALPSSDDRYEGPFVSVETKPKSKAKRVNAVVIC